MGLLGCALASPVMQATNFCSTWWGCAVVLVQRDFVGRRFAGMSSAIDGLASIRYQARDEQPRIQCFFTNQRHILLPSVATCKQQAPLSQAIAIEITKDNLTLSHYVELPSCANYQSGPRSQFTLPYKLQHIPCLVSELAKYSFSYQLSNTLS